MYERRDQRILPIRKFLLRLLYHGLALLAVVGVSLAVGMLGYHWLEHMSWIDAFLNAAMILGGMGPVSELHTSAGKVFAGLYALFAGFIFLVAAGIAFGPFVHRLLHRFHLEASSDGPEGGDGSVT